MYEISFFNKKQFLGIDSPSLATVGNITLEHASEYVSRIQTLTKTRLFILQHTGFKNYEVVKW